MGPRAGLDGSEKREFLIPAGSRTSDRQAHGTVAIPTVLPHALCRKHFFWVGSVVLEMINSLKPNGPRMYHQVQHSKILRSAHTMYLCILCGSETNSDYFPMQH